MSTSGTTKIAVFYHVAKMNNWEEVDKEMMATIKDSGLKIDVFVRNECDDIGLYEFPTLEMMREFSIRYPHYYCLYIHTKGVSQPTNHQIADWRRCMMYFLVEKYELCLKELNCGADACSINYTQSPFPHYQGNFFWAKASYIATLPPIKDAPQPHSRTINFTERHKCEMWILMKTKRIGNLYHHKINPYLENNPRSNYEITCADSEYTRRNTTTTL